MQASQTKEIYIVRKVLHVAIKDYLQKKIVNFRMTNNLSQGKMADNLLMDLRSYVDIENGKSACSMVTFVVFILLVSPDCSEILGDLRRIIKKEFDDAA